MANPLRRHREVEVGEEIPVETFAIDRGQLVRYAGASLDFNPIHWSDAAAEETGLPDVVAHGMLIMALAGRLATSWAGDPGAVVDFAVRFSGMVPVPAAGAAELRIGGRVAEKLDDGRVALELTVHSGKTEVLKNARAVLQLAK